MKKHVSTDFYKLVGSRIKENRKRIGYKSAEKFAEDHSFAFASVKDWERGACFPQTETLLKLCDIFGCDLGHLLGEYKEHHLAFHILSEKLGLSENALSNLIKANSEKDPYIEIVSQLLQDETLLRQSAAVVAASYGRVSQPFNALDPFTGESSGRIISPEDLHDLDRQHLFSALCDFLDNFRQIKEGSSNLETD